MSSFIEKGFLTPNIPIEKYDKKIILSKKNISLQFLLARDIGKTYKVVYLINILPSAQRIDPTIQISPKVIDMESLKKAIIANADIYDRNYMTLGLFDDRKAEFYFETDKWLKDSLDNNKPITKLGSFSRTILFKKRVPNMILFDPARQQFEKYLIRKFHEYTEKNKKDVEWFRSIFPNTLRSKIREKVRNMFSWEYDLTWNKLSAILKPVFVLSILYATGLAVNKLREKDTKYTNKQELFNTKVLSNIPVFSSSKFKDYVKKKGFM